MGSDEWMRIAADIMRSAQYCFLVTVGEDNRANARLMEPLGPDPDMTVWFGASPRSRKICEIRARGQATVCYESVDERAYVTLLGSARIVDDPELRRQYWKRRWEPFWPAGPLGDDYVLIAVTPDRIELMSVKQGVMPDPLTRPACLVRSEDGWKPLDEA
jgi:general stress protein 26